MKKILVVSGTRAEFGLLKPLLRKIVNSKILDLQLVITGTHLSQAYGMTKSEIIQSGFSISREVKIFEDSSDSASVNVSKAISKGVDGFDRVYDELKPDLLLILGDRYEIFSAAIAAMVSNIPIAHIHGGESTEGVIDEAIRHSITKMSHIHFVAMEKYRNRVIQLGENPNLVFCVGGLGIDSIGEVQTIEKVELEKKLPVRFSKRNLLITFHPVTLEQRTEKKQFSELLSALSKLEDTSLIFTMPNAESGSENIVNQILSFCQKHANAFFFKSLGQINYFSCLKVVDAVVGNSSSGIIEVPSFYKGTINIGNRQRGRERAKSVVDCLPNENDISKAIELIYSKDFQEKLLKIENPYGSGESSSKIIEILEQLSFKGMLKKKFYDLG